MFIPLTVLQRYVYHWNIVCGPHYESNCFRIFFIIIYLFTLTYSNIGAVMFNYVQISALSVCSKLWCATPVHRRLLQVSEK